MTRAEILSAAKPILFNMQMVRAILDERKTVTRRVIKYSCHAKSESTLDDFIGNSDPQLLISCCPYRTGDILYVQETWCWCPCWDCGMNTEKGCCDDIANRFYNDNRKETGCYGYRASFETGELPFDKWYPSIHMPKEAARIFLRVTGVHVERLREMVLADVLMEGIREADTYEETWNRWHNTWDSTIKPADLPHYGWDANPWVWVIGFERIEPEGSEL